MSHVRKTVDVAELVNLTNQFLLNSADELRGERQGVASFLEQVLHRCGAYVGFGYLYPHHMKQSALGNTPGIIFDEVDLNHEYPDDSRRIYSLHKDLIRRERLNDPKE
jgi:hypothetical protein